MTAAGYTGFPTTGNAATEPFPFWRCIAQGLEKSEPIENCTGIITNTFNKQHNYGLSGQASWLVSHNHVTAGAAWDRSSMIFQQGSQFGYLNPDRLTITPINAFADGSTHSGRRSGRYARRSARAHQHVQPVCDRYAYRWASRWHSRFRAAITGRPSTTPTVCRRATDGLARLAQRPICLRAVQSGRRAHLQSASRFASVYFSYSEASRAPTAIELGCADPNEPCNLPNALVSDPPLKQVVTRTFEAGVRGTMENNLRWSAGWFRGENYNDLLFVASEQTGFGYFTNFGQTRRQGVEASISAPDQAFHSRAAITRFWTRRIRVRRRLTAAATAPTTEVRDWMATSRFSRAIRFR